jgi:hypothetical protein
MANPVRVSRRGLTLATAVATIAFVAPAAQASTPALATNRATVGNPDVSGADSTAGRAVTDSSGTIDFSVFDPTGSIPRDQSFQLRDLTRYGIESSTVMRIASAGSESAEPASTAVPAKPTPPPDADTIEAEWKDVDGWDTVIRLGWWAGGTSTKGFGVRKIDQKHNLSIADVKATTMYPRPIGGKVRIPNTNRYEYRTDVLHIQCSGWWIFKSCRPVGVQTVLAAVDFTNPYKGQHKPFGVVTTYCEGIQGRCPDWVRNAANV